MHLCGKKYTPTLGKHRERQNVSNMLFYFYLFLCYLIFDGFGFQINLFSFYLCFFLTSSDSAGSRRCVLSQNSVKEALITWGWFMKASPGGKHLLPSQAVAWAGVKTPGRSAAPFSWPLGEGDQKVTPPGTRPLSTATLALLYCTALAGLFGHLPCVRMLITEMLSSWKFYYNNPLLLLWCIYSPSIWPTVQTTVAQSSKPPRFYYRINETSASVQTWRPVTRLSCSLQSGKISRKLTQPKLFYDSMFWCS